MKRVLIACEESQRVCIEFRKRGFQAYSCDILPCSGGHPEWHYQGDVRNVLYGDWDLIIAHPPCTRLCNSGQRWLFYGDSDYQLRKKAEQQEAIDFFMLFTDLDCEHIAIENPVGIMSSLYRKPDQIYNPYDFKGETECKKTCLWLKNLPVLKPTQVLSKELRTQGIWKAQFDGKQYRWNDPRVAGLRSKTPWGVAAAMAEQWGKVIEDAD